MKSMFKRIGIIVFVAVIGFSFVSCGMLGDLFGKEEEEQPEHEHQWGAWTITAATAITDGVETRTCSLDPSHTETRFSGEYATGTPGLAYEAIGSPATAYRVRKGTVTTGAVHIPAFHRLNANSPYLPVTEIGASDDWSTNGAFQSTSITAVTFAPNSQLISISAWAFSGCTSLTGITLPSSVTSIGYCAFSNCTSLTGVTIPASVMSIGQQAFSQCSALTSITIPVGVMSIGMMAFERCTSFTSITVAANNPNYSSEGGILYNKAKTTLIQAPQAISGSITIPASVTAIGDSAFIRCTGLTSITIPAGVTAIGDYAFSGWTALQTINVQGKANQAAADAAWGDYWWRYGCNAIINYNG